MITEKDIVEIFKEYNIQNIWNEVNPNQYHIIDRDYILVAKAILDKVKEKEIIRGIERCNEHLFNTKG